MKDFNLSDKIKGIGKITYPYYAIPVSDVKEFIRLVKEDIEIIFKGMNRPHTKDLILYRIDERAGEELSETSSEGCGKVSAGDEVCGEDYVCHECYKHHKSLQESENDE